MTSTAAQTVPTEQAIKQAIIALIKENNAQFKQLLADALPKSEPSVAKKEQHEAANQNGSAAPKPRIPYSEMPFWKANPHLKPRVPEGEGTTLAAIKELQAFFQEPGNEITDVWFDMLD
jgi:hypothetical protein